MMRCRERSDVLIADTLGLREPDKTFIGKVELLCASSDIVLWLEITKEAAD